MRKKCQLKITAKTETVLFAKMLLCIIMLYAEYRADTFLDSFFYYYYFGIARNTIFEIYHYTNRCSE